jgi:hypothetical protein
MKSRKSLWVLVFILAVLCLVFFWQKHSTDDTEDTLSIPALSNLEPTSFSYENSSGSFHFAKSDDTWTAEESKGCEVKQSTVSEFLDTLKQLPVSRELIQPDDLADYGLDAPEAKVTLTQGNTTQTLSFSEKQDTVYLSLGDESTVYVLSEMPSQLDNTMLDWLDTPVMPYVKTENITALSAKGYTLERLTEAKTNSSSDSDSEEETAAAWRITTPSGASQTIEESDALSDLLTSLSNLYFADCVDFGVTESEQLAAYGLSQPAGTFTLSYTDADTKESGSYTLSLGSTAADGSTYVKLADSSYISLLSSDLTETLEKNLDAFLDSLS